MWKSRRGFVWRTYDARNFDEWSTAKEKSPSKAHRLRPIARQVVWRNNFLGSGPLMAASSYDTFDAVLSLGVVSEAGLCMACGGKRAPRRCGCPDYDYLELLPPVDDHGHCEACSRPRSISRTCACVPEGNDRPSKGMLAWRAWRESHRPPAQDLYEFPETDDTPGVLVDVSMSE